MLKYPIVRYLIVLKLFERKLSFVLYPKQKQISTIRALRSKLSEKFLHFDCPIVGEYTQSRNFKFVLKILRRGGVAKKKTKLKKESSTLKTQKKLVAKPLNSSILKK